MVSFDWQQGLWRAEGGGSPDARIMVTGDWAPLRDSAERVVADPEGIYGDLLPLLRRADLAVTNVEGVLGDAGSPIRKDGPNLRGPAAAVAALRAPPFHVATMANNHVFDFGPEGLAETLRLLDAAGIRTVGAGLTEGAALAPLVVEVGRAKVGLVNFSEGEDATAAGDGRPGVFGWDVERVVADVAALRRRADVVIVICHAGREHTPLPPPYVVRTYRRVAEAGADVIVAHHPHVPQGLEIHGGVPIAYSTGNFVFYDRGAAFFRKAGYMVELELTGKRLTGLCLLPYRLAPQGLELVRGELLTWMLGRLRRVSEPLADPSAVREVWNAFIDQTCMGDPPLVPRILRRILESFDEDSALGAARLRNLFVTRAHVELWTDYTNRVVRGEMGTAAPWAADLVREWTTMPVAEALRCPA